MVRSPFDKGHAGVRHRCCQTQHYLVLALFWCNQAESGGAIVKKPRQLIECQRLPTPSLTKTDSTVYISLKTWDFLVPGDSDLHQKRARTFRLGESHRSRCADRKDEG